MRKLAADVRLQMAIDDTKMLLAKGPIAQMQGRDLLPRLQDAEFKVFSQWGDDGIIQYLLSMLDIQHQTFIEFGVENYDEANTRFLLINNNWRGLIIDSDQQNIEDLKNGEYYWRYDLTAVASFVDRDTINALFDAHGFRGPIGLLSIDIDGTDYWVWEAITVVEPTIVIVEYNSVFGDRHAITIPYDPAFDRTRAHYSNLFFGASLPALCLLASRKGYSFVGSNSAGNNAYFVRTDTLGPLQARTAQDGYVRSKFRELQHETTGGNSYVAGDERLRLISGSGSG